MVSKGSDDDSRIFYANHSASSYDFPKRAFRKKTVVYRSCHAEWFKSWSWLHYEDDKDAMLCHVYTRAAREGKLKNANAEPAFVSYKNYLTKIAECLIIYIGIQGVLQLEGWYSSFSQS